jgi:hypothetical protein
VDLSIVFFPLVAAAIVLGYLDWYKSAKLIAQYGLQFEKNVVMRFFLSKSKWLALAYKSWPMPLLTWGAYFHFHDIQNYGVEYANAPGQKDHWAIAWILTAVVGLTVNAFGYFKSGVKK